MIIHRRAPLTIELGINVTEFTVRANECFLASIGFNSEVRLTIGNRFDGISVADSPPGEMG